ncbi:Double-strand break repair protein mre11a [Perkinsus chesapeaki]|uniref:Double-strand break repair protein mre11a n=1 Tax=Perkinsus chesapeaki TaxID=330153 RepID=A0A7J6M7Y8_PERCH|nr:Double-strand break repair protein mre11a [Perkinsus chesapeaki]
MTAAPSTTVQVADPLRPRYINTSGVVNTAVLGISGAWFYFYCVPLRRKEWYDIMMDYVHHKRTQYAPNMPDKVARTALRVLNCSVVKMVAESDNIKVAVRVRPLNQREIDLGAQSTVTMSGGECKVVSEENGPSSVAEARSGKQVQTKTFAFDYCYDSMNQNSSNYADQSKVYNDLGEAVLNNALQGYNGCMFAYGQTGSGKSYSMLGGKGDPGIIPRITKALFSAAGKGKKEGYAQTRVWVSYLEIYNERIKDLLSTEQKDGETVTIFDKPGSGVLVSGMVEAAVDNIKEVKGLLDYGTAQRAVGATNMNAQSSRSHAVFILRLQRVSADPTVKPDLDARINLVDLAGSERQDKSGASGGRLKEAIAINQSLSTLARVISGLAEGKSAHIPFRNSKLTFLLKDSLSGNSKTFMVACISPALTELSETVSTLRFAHSAKMVKTKAKQNKVKPDAELDALRKELQDLGQQLSSRGGSLADSQARSQEQDEEIKRLKAELEEREQRMKTMATDFEEQLKAARKAAEERARKMEKRGLVSTESIDKDKPYLLNVSSDPLLNGTLAWQLSRSGGDILLGSDKKRDKIIVAGLGIPEGEPLCKFVVSDAADQHTTVEVLSSEGVITLNGVKLEKGGKPTKLRHLDNLVCGKAIMLRMHYPKMGGSRQTFEEAMSKTFGALVQENHLPSELAHYLQKARDKWGKSSMEYKLIEEFTVMKLYPLVDEANLISKDMFPCRTYQLNVEIFVDRVRPEGERIDPEDYVFARLSRETSAGSKDFKSVCTLTYSQLEGRVEVMREIYHVFHKLAPYKRAKLCGIKAPSDPKQKVDLHLHPDSDPWLPHAIIKEEVIVHDKPAPPPPSKRESEKEAAPEQQPLLEEDTSGSDDGDGPMASNDGNVGDESLMRIMVITDNHVGHKLDDPVRSLDSVCAFEEAMQRAKLAQVDLVVHGGDLFDVARPDRLTMKQVNEILRQTVMGDQPIRIQVLPTQDENGVIRDEPPNYEDPNYNVGLPVFMIHGNHDEPGGAGNMSVIDLLHTNRLVNYFGQQMDLDRIVIRPILIQKGETKLALYGLGNMRDERLNRAINAGKVRFEVPPGEGSADSESEYFSVMLVHQNRYKGAAGGVPGSSSLQNAQLPSFLDLVIWGHEHESIVDPVETAQGFSVLQPGSSMQTSLSAGESLPKHIFLLELLKGRGWRTTPIPLTSPRPLLVQDVSMKELIAQRERRSDGSGESMEELAWNSLSGVVKAMVSHGKDLGKQQVKAYKQWLEESGVTPLYKRDSARAARPLIRLRVDVTVDEDEDGDGGGGGLPAGSSYPVIPNQKFGQQFLEEVANPADILLLHKKKKRAPRQKKNELQINLEDHAAGGVGGDAGADRDQMQDIIFHYVNGADCLDLIPETRLNEVVQEYVHKNETTAITQFVSDVVKQTTDSIEADRAHVPAQEGVIREAARTRAEGVRRNAVGGSEPDTTAGQQSGMSSPGAASSRISSNSTSSRGRLPAVKEEFGESELDGMDSDDDFRSVQPVAGKPRGKAKAKAKGKAKAKAKAKPKAKSASRTIKRARETAAGPPPDRTKRVKTSTGGGPTSFADFLNADSDDEDDDDGVDNAPSSMSRSHQPSASVPLFPAASSSAPSSRVLPWTNQSRRTSNK